MLKGLTFLPALALSAALALPAHAEPGAGTVVARINGEEITLGHMIIAHATLPQQYRELPPDVLYNAILDQLIQQTALKQSRTGPAPGHVELSLDNERRSLLAADEVERIMSGAASDEAVKAAYDEAYADGFGGDEYNASHILVDSREEAEAIKAELEAGADFAETAKARSTGPSGPNGGSLGWFGRGAMLPEFEVAVTALETGQISEPIQTKYGWHVIILNESRKTDAPELAAVSDDIANNLRQKAVQDRVEELTRAAEIERPEIEGLDPTILRDLDLVRN